MMTKWLRTDLPNTLPSYASHYVGMSLTTPMHGSSCHQTLFLSPDTLPACSVLCCALLTTFWGVSVVGVAGFVVTDDNRLLLIQERYLVSLKYRHWKLPGGLADPGKITWSSSASLVYNCPILLLRCW